MADHHIQLMNTVQAVQLMEITFLDRQADLSPTVSGTNIRRPLPFRDNPQE